MRHQINSARCRLLHPLSFLIPLKFQQVEREQNRKFMRYTHWVAMSLKDLQRNIIHKSWGARRACHLEMSTCHRSWRRRKQLRIYQWLQGFRSIDSSQSYEISDLQKTLIKHIMSHSSEEPRGCCWKTFLVITSLRFLKQFAQIHNGTSEVKNICDEIVLMMLWIHRFADKVDKYNPIMLTRRCLFLLSENKFI